MLDPDDVKDLRGLLRSLVRKAGREDPAAFAQVVRLIADAEALLPEAAAALIEAGHSWTDIADELGQERSAPRKRYGRGRRPQPTDTPEG